MLSILEEHELKRLNDPVFNSLCFQFKNIIQLTEKYETNREYIFWSFVQNHFVQRYGCQMIDECIFVYLMSSHEANICENNNYPFSLFDWFRKQTPINKRKNDCSIVLEKTTDAFSTSIIKSAFGVK